MNLKTIFSVAVVCTAIAAVANAEAPRPKVDMSPEAQYKRTGGQIVKKGTFTGKVAFIDTQNVVSFDVAQKIAKLLADTVEINVVAEKSASGKPEANHQGRDKGDHRSQCHGISYPSEDSLQSR